MRLTGRLFALAAALAPGLPPAAAAPAPGIRWVTSITAGLGDAKSKGLPLMVALNMDRERGNESMVKEVYTDPVVVAAAARCVCTIGSISSHETVKDPATGRMVCARFGSLTCPEHKAVERVIREQWLKKTGGEDVNSPQHFFLAPDGRRLFQRTWTLDARELAALMKRAGELCTPASLAAWDTPEGRLQRAADPLRPVREEALASLAAMKDPAVDSKLGAIAKGATDEGLASDILDAFAAAMSPARTAVAAGFLGAKAPALRMHAAVALEAAKDAEALKHLLAALGREKEAAVRGVLYRAVAGCGPGDDGARAAVLAGLKEKGPEALPHAIVALAAWARDPVVTAMLGTVAFGTGPWEARAAACWSLGESGQKDLAPALREIQDDTRARRVGYVAQLAARRLEGGVGDPEYRRAVKGFAWSPVRHPGEPED